MRRILVDHARSRRSLKRGSGAAREPLSESVASPVPAGDVVDLDEALTRLSALDPRKGRVVELYYFAGLRHEEIAGLTDTSPATVDRDLRFARAWLKSRLQEGQS